MNLLTEKQNDTKITGSTWQFKEPICRFMSL